MGLPESRGRDQGGHGRPRAAMAAPSQQGVEQLLARHTRDVSAWICRLAKRATDRDLQRSIRQRDPSKPLLQGPPECDELALHSIECDAKPEPVLARHFIDGRMGRGILDLSIRVTPLEIPRRDYPQRLSE